MDDANLRVTYRYPLEGDASAAPRGQAVSEFYYDEESGSVVHTGEFPPQYLQESSCQSRTRAPWGDGRAALTRAGPPTPPVGGPARVRKGSSPSRAGAGSPTGCGFLHAPSRHPQGHQNVHGAVPPPGAIHVPHVLLCA